MRLCIQDNPKCPMCREEISLVADSAPKVEKCVCSDENCSPLLLMSVDDNKVRNILEGSRSMVECTTCTVQKCVAESGGFNLLYRLYK